MAAGWIFWRIAVNPEPHAVRGLSPILQKKYPLSAPSLPTGRQVSLGGEKGV